MAGTPGTTSGTTPCTQGHAASKHSGSGHSGSGHSGSGHTVPAPRGPLAESLRRFLPKLDAPPPLDLEQVCRDLVEVAAWTSRDGCWQEHASFLLGTADGRWHIVGFGEPSVSGLIPRLRALPGFDTDLLLDLIGSHREQLAVLWKRDVTEDPTAVG